MPGCYAPARPCRGTCRGWATRPRTTPRGGRAIAEGTGYAPAYVQLPATHHAMMHAGELAHFYQDFFFHTDTRMHQAASVTPDAPGMRAHTPGTASARYRVHWHARAYTRTASLRYRSWMHWCALHIRQYCIRAQHKGRTFVLFKADSEKIALALRRTEVAAARGEGARSCDGGRYWWAVVGAMPQASARTYRTNRTGTPGSPRTACRRTGRPHCPRT